MNRTSFEHAAIAVLIQVGIALLTDNWLAGGCAAAFVFIGREHAQAEYRWIAAFGSGYRANMPAWGGFDPRVWNKLDPWLDWLLPSASVGAVYLVSRMV